MLILIPSVSFHRRLRWIRWMCESRNHHVIGVLPYNQLTLLERSQLGEKEKAGARERTTDCLAWHFIHIQISLCHCTVLNIICRDTGRWNYRRNKHVIGLRGPCNLWLVLFACSFRSFEDSLSNNLNLIKRLICYL